MTYTPTTGFVAQGHIYDAGFMVLCLNLCGSHPWGVAGYFLLVVYYIIKLV